jgi:beta-glucosidase-like glycosyl hydrolase
MNAYSRLIPRLNGKEIEERFEYYFDLVKKGVAGFIVFGGELETVRQGIKKLQDASPQPLIIASDLEQGLGQQIEGGTIFPPAMAVASALKTVRRDDASPMLRKLYTAFAVEALYTGINTILAPVLDINTNPLNPIIATRAFGEDPDSVSFFGCEMIRVLQENGIMSCGKHFPGHGDTEIDSHITLPVIHKGLSALEHHELIPFKRAIHEGVGMIMLGHLSVPSLDTSGKPASISERVVSYLKSNMTFKGLVITDAMNMGALGGYHENEASLIALNAGVDLLLHPTDPDDTALFLRQRNCLPQPLTLNLTKSPNAVTPDFKEHREFSEEISRIAITIDGEYQRKIKKPFVLLVHDEHIKKGDVFLNEMKHAYPGINYYSIFPEDDIPLSAFPEDCDLIVCVFSKIKAWKGKNAAWLRKTVQSLEGTAKIFISFGNPYVVKGLKNATKVYAFWDSDSAQKAVAERIIAT